MQNGNFKLCSHHHHHQILYCLWNGNVSMINSHPTRKRIMHMCIFAIVAVPLPPSKIPPRPFVDVESSTGFDLSDSGSQSKLRVQIMLGQNKALNIKEQRFAPRHTWLEVRVSIEYLAFPLPRLSCFQIQRATPKSRNRCDNWRYAPRPRP